MTEQLYADLAGDATPAGQSTPSISNEMLRKVAIVARRSLDDGTVVTLDGAVMQIWKADDAWFFREHPDRRLRLRLVYPAELHGDGASRALRVLVLLTGDGIYKTPVPNGVARDIAGVTELADTEANCLALLELLECTYQTAQSPGSLQNALPRVLARAKVLEALPLQTFDCVRSALIEAHIAPEGLA